MGSCFASGCGFVRARLAPIAPPLVLFVLPLVCIASSSPSPCIAAHCLMVRVHLWKCAAASDIPMARATTGNSGGMNAVWLAIVFQALDQLQEFSLLLV